MKYEISNEKAREIWLNQLVRFRQTWPEWNKLEQILPDYPVHLEDFAHTEDLFLAGTANEEGIRLIHLISNQKWECESESEFLVLPQFLPKYVIPLVDLKWTNDLMMAGGLAVRIAPGYQEIITQKDGERCILTHYEGTPRYDAGALEPLLLDSDPQTIKFPPFDLYTFQSSPSGIPVFFIDSKELNIFLFNPRTREFDVIGSLPNFLRYCLRSILRKEDWYSAYQKQDSLKGYDLRYRPHLED